MSIDSYMMFVSFIKRRLSVMKFNEGYFDSQGDIKVYYIAGFLKIQKELSR